MLRRLLFIVIAFAATIALAREAALDVIAQLRGSGVQTRTTWSAKAKATAPKMPTVAPLRGFPARVDGSRRWKTFDDCFRAGAFRDSALIAVGGQPKSARPRRDLPRLWKKAAPSKRVFISFAREDLPAVRKVRRELERKGYVCFTYVRGQSKEPWANAVEVGRYFREAGRHLVVDSRAARRSRGVQVEALALPAIRKAAVESRTPVPATRMRGRQRVPAARGQPCCKLCEYVNGVLVGCGPVTCGPQCVNALP
jgi:hypothetical protein